ncbi:hypothetical protein A9K65_026740 [Mesorhizobium sp. WSM1497]|nr:hypothetical protein A9K65_026740 [Mesorhizobium sp. WSM1497]
MAEHWFSPKVPVRTLEGHRYNVGSVEACAEVLMTWTKRGPRWTKAVGACVKALNDEAPPESVRGPFRAAAEEEGKLLRDITE